MLLIYCDGGLGNRLNCLSNGLYLAQQLKVGFTVYWPKNRYCNADLHEIIDSDIVPVNKGKAFIRELGYLAIVSEDNFIDAADGLHLNPLLLFSKEKLFNDIERILKAKGKIIVFYPRPLPQIYSRVCEVIRRIEFKPHIVQKFEQEKNYLGLTTGYWGLHMRGTDARSSDLYYKFWRFISYVVPGRVLLVSDDQSIIDFFRKNPSIVTRRIVVLPNKSSNDCEWNSKTVDENLELLPYNVSRSTESVIDAAVDLLLLAETKILFTSKSTFLELAINLSRYQFLIYRVFLELLAKSRNAKRVFRRVFRRSGG